MPKRSPPAEPLMHGIYCHRYYTKNRKEVNEKTRERMRRLRASDNTIPPEVLLARLEARRASARGYRERNQWKLKMKARAARAVAAEERRQKSFPQQSTAESSNAHSDIAGLTDGERAKNHACIEEAALCCEERLRSRRQLRQYNSLGAAWERFQVYHFFGALRLAMALQTARDAGIDLRCVAVDTRRRGPYALLRHKSRHLVVVLIDVESAVLVGVEGVLESPIEARREFAMLEAGKVTVTGPFNALSVRVVGADALARAVMRKGVKFGESDVWTEYN
ncbi:hypothetical protein B0H11DRAFT_1930384 [Mycena galericulata]|nr:hypothetical protein B0H11DRAFT_1930384 [Mycena galericulata]